MGVRGRGVGERWPTRTASASCRCRRRGASGTRGDFVCSLGRCEQWTRLHATTRRRAEDWSGGGGVRRSAFGSGCIVCDRSHAPRVPTGGWSVDGAFGIRSVDQAARWMECFTVATSIGPSVASTGSSLAGSSRRAASACGGGADQAGGERVLPDARAAAEPHPARSPAFDAAPAPLIS